MILTSRQLRKHLEDEGMEISQQRLHGMQKKLDADDFHQKEPFCITIYNEKGIEKIKKMLKK